MSKELKNKEEIEQCRRDLGITSLVAKDRVCMDCGEIFASVSAGHRKCNSCANKQSESAKNYKKRKTENG